MISIASSSDIHVREMLKRHPRVQEVREGDHPGVDFQVGTWSRSVLVDSLQTDIKGLVELMDNNPMVCADRVSVPSAGATLALIAFGPLTEAGLVVEPPSLIVSHDSDGQDVASWLTTAGWKEGVTLQSENQDLGTALAATGMAAIRTPADWNDIDDLYEERFGRSFFVRRDEDSIWATSLVDDQPSAVYRLRYTPGEEHSLLTISVLADRNGKCGAAQVIHAMNVMAGFEESLGISS